MNNQQKMAVLLAGSLGLNLFLAGAGSMHWMHRADGPEPMAQDFRSGPPGQRGPAGPGPADPGSATMRDGGPGRLGPGRLGPRAGGPHAGGPRDGTAEGAKKGNARGQRDGAAKGAGQSNFSMGPGSPDMMLRPVIRAMGGPRDPRVAKFMKAHREEHREIRTKLQAAQQKVREAFVAESYDEKALESALAAMNREGAAAGERAQAALSELAAQMTVEERAGLRELLTQRMEKQGARKQGARKQGARKQGGQKQ